MIRFITSLWFLAAALASSAALTTSAPMPSSSSSSTYVSRSGNVRRRAAADTTLAASTAPAQSPPSPICYTFSDDGLVGCACDQDGQCATQLTCCGSMSDCYYDGANDCSNANYLGFQIVNGTAAGNCTAWGYSCCGVQNG